MGAVVETQQRPGVVPPRPSWDLLKLFPAEGNWGESDYLALDRHPIRENALIELIDGRIEVLPMPSFGHQGTVQFLLFALLDQCKRMGRGTVRNAPLPLRLWEGRWREPDVMFMFEVRRDSTGNYLAGADLVIEVVSPDDPRRDLEEKRWDYAAAGIPEYWIVDPRTQDILVLTLPTGAEHYVEHGRFTRGERAASKLLAGFSVAVDEVFDAANT